MGKFDEHGSGFIYIHHLLKIMTEICGWSASGDEANDLLDDIISDCLSTAMLSIEAPADSSRKELERLVRTEFLAGSSQGKAAADSVNPKVKLNYMQFLAW